MFVVLFLADVILFFFSYQLFISHKIIVSAKNDLVVSEYNLFLYIVGCFQAHLHQFTCSAGTEVHAFIGVF